jgi:glycosyltransferase family protein
MIMDFNSNTACIESDWKSKMKESIRKMIPQEIWNHYRTAKRLPAYLKATWEMRNEKYPKLCFYSDQAAIDLIIDQRMSLSRFGDGEIKWMLGEAHHSFQTYSESLSQDLRRAYQSQNEKLLIGIPYALIDSHYYKYSAKMYWETVKGDYYTRLLKLTKPDRTYCDACISRPYIDYRKGRAKIQNFQSLKHIWHHREIVIVEGKETRMGIGNDLFDNAASVRRILCPCVNAYGKINEIKQSIRRNVAHGDLILCALGPTASVLAADMSAEGYQMLDIGHLDIEYMWFLKRAKQKVPIDGKYVNEVADKSRPLRYAEDDAYATSVIDKIE